MFNHLESFFESLWDKLLRGSLDGPSAGHPSQAPWDSWELDPDFFMAMSCWTLGHPETTLERVLDKICVGVNAGKDLLELIPDSPFPARGLVKALGYLVKLGTTVSRANTEVQTFAKDVIQWVGEIQSAFQSHRNSHITWRTKRNLRKMRALIDEICKWATARLNDGRWSRITHGLSIAQEIEEFKSRISSAREIFMDLTVINLSQGLDLITREIKIIRKLQQDQLKSIHDKLDAQMQAETRRQFLSQMLKTRTVANATYDEQGKQPCDADTRITILADIDSWIRDCSGDSQSFLWLTGDPGSGKSAITASVARECKDAKILWAQFFINRNNADTTDPRSYFPSIARQLVDHIPDSPVALAIHSALQNKCSLVDDISREQATGLFIDAIEVASKLDPQKPVVIVIDGLDETSRPRLRFTAEIFSELFAKLRCSNVKVFISSRTEDDIQKPFSKAFDIKYVKHIHLDTTADSSVQDVSNFLAKRIAEIVENNDLNWEEWPGKERMQVLCVRASGLFIWAATVVKFFQEQIDLMGRECLNGLLDALSTKGMGDINVLYGTILRLLYRDEMDDWVFETFRRVVGCIVVLQEPLCLTEIDDLIDLRQTASSTRVDIKHFVRRLRTVLVAGANIIDGHTIPRLHKSFFEFIISKRADSHFRVDMDRSHIEVAIQCLRQLVSLSVADCHSNPPLRYALEFWPSHMPPEMMAGVAVAAPIKLPLLQELFQILSRRVIEVPSIRIALSSDREQILTSSDIAIHLWDAKNGVQFRFPLEGHTGAVCSVAFSPDGKQIISGSLDCTIRLWNAHSGLPFGSPLEGHNSSVKSVAFSPDGKQIVSGSSDYGLRLWDAQSGQPIGSPLKGHTASVRSVMFSPDGKQIVSGSSDHTLRLWDAQSGQPIGSFTGHPTSVHSVAFSPDGKEIVSGLGDGTLHVWDAQSGQPIGSPLKGHTSSVRSVMFSPDGKQIISGSNDCTLRLWDAQSGQPIGSAFQGHTKRVCSVAFSPDGKQIISGSEDCTLRLWDARSSQSIKSPFTGHTSYVNSVAFSADGKQIVSGSMDKTLHLWDVASGLTIKFPIQRHSDMVTSFALSPDGTKIVSASWDDTVHIWNARTGQPIGSPLKGNIKRVISLTFSPDGSQFGAASSDSTICLWDTESRELIGLYHQDCITQMSLITFSSDGRHLMTSSVDGTIHIWNATNGKPINTAISSDTSASANNNPFIFSMRRGWCREEADEALLRCYPVDNPDFGHWAYIDNTLIRRDKTGLTTITDTSQVQRR